MLWEALEGWFQFEHEAKSNKIEINFKRPTTKHDSQMINVSMVYDAKLCARTMWIIQWQHTKWNGFSLNAAFKSHLLLHRHYLLLLLIFDIKIVLVLVIVLVVVCFLSFDFSFWVFFQIVLVQTQRMSVHMLAEEMKIRFVTVKRNYVFPYLIMSSNSIT